MRRLSSPSVWRQSMCRWRSTRAHAERDHLSGCAGWLKAALVSDSDRNAGGTVKRRIENLLVCEDTSANTLRSFTIKSRVMSPIPGNWPRVREIFEAAVSLPTDARRSYVAKSCGEDPSVRQQVELLLDSHERAQRSAATSSAQSLNATGMTRSLEGNRVGPYLVGQRVGAGGMGEVYKARDARLNRTVAIKVLPAHLAHDSQARDRFEQEARAIAGLNHPHICTLYDIGNQDGVDFLVMEYLDGDTLSGPMPAEEALRLATQIAGAVADAHRHGILHRDLKPGNVMLTTAGAKVLDFGLAKSMNTEPGVTSTNVGTVVGTVAYMSPEQAAGKPLDARSDIFSFGAVLYEMLSGTRAFGGTTTAEVLSAVLRDDPPPLRPSTILSPIVQKCLAKQPGQRYQTMDDVQTALAQTFMTPVKEAPSIAVLPFASLSADAENEFFSDGISEEIINALGQIEGLRVAARSSSFSFKGKSIEVGDIARRLDVRHVLEGSVRKAGTRVRVMAQLVNAANGFQLWSERYDRQIADIFDVQEEIARAIVERLRVAFDASESPRLVKVTTKNMEAYQEYLKGRAMLYRRGPWIASALECFQKAVALDPGYAQAWAGVADAHTALAYYGYGRPTETMPSTVEAAVRATVIDPESAEAHNALAVGALLWERDFGKAEREFREALTLNPRYTQARCWYGLFFLQWGVGRDQDGLAEARLAFENDPLSAYATTVLSLALATVRRHDEAVLQARNAVQLDPESFLAKWELACAYHWNGQHEDAIAIFEPLWANSGHSWVTLGLVPAYMRTGREDRARSLYESLVDRHAREYVQPFVLALSATAVGDHEAAIGFCEAAIEGRDMLFALFSRWWPDFEPVRADPRYDGILVRFNSRDRTGP
jgi:serine/threonine protein kinase/Flp pilus assembly protein TadD